MSFGRFDRYVFFTFLRYWVVVGLAILSLFSVLDFLGKADEIGRGIENAEKTGATVWLALQYYLWSLPFLLVQFAPFLTVLAGIATVLQLRRTREWTPVLTAGQSTWRSFRPMLTAAILLGLVVFGVREVGFSIAQPHRMEAHDPFFRDRPWEARDLWARGAQDIRLHAVRFVPGNPPTMHGLEVYSVDHEGRDHLLRAKKATWSGTRWDLQGASYIVAGMTEATPTVFQVEGLEPSALLVFHYRDRQPLELTRGQLLSLLVRDPHDRQAATLAWNFLFSPLAHVLLLLLGLPFVLRFDRSSSMEGVAIGLLLCALFFVGDLIFVDLGTRGVLAPWLAGSGSVLLFGSLGWVAADRLPT